jgi:LmbE family N-acetylglucosaminyl deacetylase
LLGLEFNAGRSSPFRVLCLGAHSDDLEIGCGGTILRLLRELKDVSIFWVVLSSDDRRGEEARKSAVEILGEARDATVEVKEFRNGFFPYVGERIKEYFEELKGKTDPDLIFTHFRHDLHQDHRVVSELTWNTFRDHMILEYEIPKFDGDMGSPNLFVPLDRGICEKKVEIIIRSFPSQREKKWFTDDLFLSILRIRGMECNSKHGFAEGFFCRKAALLS